MATAKDLFDISVAAGSDLSAKQHYLVKRSAGSLALCSVAGEMPLGVLQDDPAASGRAGLVRVGGLTKVVLGGTVTQDQLLTVDTAGKAVAVGDTGGYAWGRANEAGSSGATISAIIGLGGMVGVGTGKATVSLPLSAARELSSNEIINAAGIGGILSKDSTPNLEAINAGTDQQLQLEWASSNSDKICWDIACPQDLDPAYAATLHFYAKSGGATDTPTATWEVFQGVGDTDAGGATGAVSATLAELTRTIAAGALTPGGGGIVLTLTPGAHTTDTYVIQGAAWMEYTRK